MAHTWLHDVVGWMGYIQDAGWTGWFIFIGLYAFCCLFFIPGSILSVAAGTVYGFYGGVVLVLVGNGVGSLLNLLIARYLLHGRMSAWIKKHPPMQAFEEAVAQDDIKLVFLTRLSPVMPFSLINYSLGLTSISPWRFLLATELGALPATCLYVYIGSLIGNLARLAPELHAHRPIEWIVQGIGLALAIGVTLYIAHLAKDVIHKRMKPRQT